jgi:phospholipase C
VSDDQYLDRLMKLQHIVVVMMENRSFDHMLGYLAGDADLGVEGLRGGEYNLDRNGHKVPVHAFDADANHVLRPGEALRKALDPDHSKGGVTTQLGAGYKDHPHPDGHNGGFVQAFAETRKKEDHVDPKLWGVPMGYYTAKDVPTYDFLARTFCVCDRWHSSVPGDTWPNRQYSVTGDEGDRVKLSFLKGLAGLLPGHPSALTNAPIFDKPAFTRHLDDKQWRWYSHDPATLRAIDGRYRDFTHTMRENFAFFDRKQVSLLTEGAEASIVGGDSFLDDAANGKLRPVSWIDPNFVDLSVLDPNSNDDHPPSDIRAGQAFVLQVYEALRRSRTWQDTLLVVVYDEHGGFYDHVKPPPVNDDPRYHTLGVRVPALLVGPRVAKGVCHQVFDHTSLITTILRRFAHDPDHAVAQMSRRVQAAHHVGVALADEPRTDIPDHSAIRSAMDAWRSAARAKREATPDAKPSPAPDGAGQPLVLQQFQQEIVQLTHALHQAGLPPGQP